MYVSVADRSETMQVLLAQSGDREALGALLTRVQPSLSRYLRMVTRDDARADDVLQDTLVIVVRKLRSLKDAQLFRPWIYRIATREAHRGRTAEEVPLDGIAEPAGGEDLLRTLATAEQDSRLREAVRQLPDRAREAVALHYFEELPLHQIAALLDVPLGTVKSRVAYGLARLRTREREP